MQAEYLEEGLAFSNMHKHVTWACERQPLPSPLFWYNRLIQNVLGCNLSNKYNTDGLWKFELFKLEEADIEKFCKVLLYKTATPDKAGKHCAFQGQLTQGIANHVCGLGCKGTALYPQPSCDPRSYWCPLEPPHVILVTTVLPFALQTFSSEVRDDKTLCSLNH